MADDLEGSAKRSYPYMSVQAWHDIRARLRRNVPRVLDADWVASVLSISEKAAKNIVPQLRTMGLMDPQGAPNVELINDVREDETYPKACEVIREAVYPPAIRDAFHADQDELQPVASWFMRNAGTGEATAKPQARFYLAITKAELPTGDEQPKAPRARRQSNGAGSRKSASSKAQESAPDSGSAGVTETTPLPPPGGGTRQPSLHVDLQIHISADAGKDQIDAIFESMARHLYGRTAD